jgi:CBS domain-containing protein
LEINLLGSDEVVNEILTLPVNTVMRREFLSFSKSDPVSSIIIKMITEDIGAAVIVEKNKPVGIITEKDVLARAVSLEKDLYKTSAEEVMSKPAISIESGHTIKEALDLMHKHNVRRLPVIDKGVLVGLVTERRLLGSIGKAIY